MVRAVIIAIALLTTSASLGRAQEPVIFGAPGQGLGPTAEQTFPVPELAPVDWHVFQWAWDNVEVPIEASRGQLTGGVLAYVRPIALAAVTLWLYLFCAAYLFQQGDSFLVQLVRHGMKWAFVLMLLGSVAQIETFVVQPLAAIPGDLLGHLQVGGQTIQRGGGQFDAIANQVSKTVLTELNHISGPIEALEVAPVAGLAWLVSEVSVGITFLFWMLTNALLQIALTLAPAAVAASAFPQSRFIMRGWISATAGLIGTQVMLGIVLAMILTTVHHVSDPITAANANVSVSGTLAVVMQMAAVMCILVGCAFQVRSLAAAIFGAAHAGWGSIARAASAIGNAAPSFSAPATVAAGSGGGMAAAGARGFVGRSL